MNYTDSASRSFQLEAFAGGYNKVSSELLDAAAEIFGTTSSNYLSLKSLVTEYQQAWTHFVEAANLQCPSFAFIKTVGSPRKQELIDLFFSAEPSSESVNHSGNKPKVRWYGHIPPAHLDKSNQQWQRMDTTHMPDLGMDYLLACTPPINSIGQDQRQELKHAVGSASIKVMELAEDNIESELWQDWLTSLGGGVILPVIRLGAKSTQDYDHPNSAVIQDWQRSIVPRLQKKIPKARIASPVTIPHLHAAGGNTKDYWNHAHQDLHKAMQQALFDYPQEELDRSGELESIWLSFEQAVSSHLTGFRSELIRERSEELTRSLQTVPAKTVQWLLSDKRKISSLIRLRLRDELVSKLPDLAFPFKTIAGVISLTVGAWDRLILAGAGSLPSGLITAGTAIKGARENIASQRELNEQLEGRILSITRTELSSPWENFVAALNRAMENGGVTTSAKPGFKITGAENLAANWRESIEQACKKSTSTKALPPRVTAALATAVFWTLLAGPFYATYGQYCEAWWQTFTGQAAIECSDNYPSPGFNFWLTSIILSVIPAFALALALVSSHLRPGRVNAGIIELEKSIQHKLENHQLGLSIHAKDKKIDATKTLVLHSNNHNTP